MMLHSCQQLHQSLLAHILPAATAAHAALNKALGYSSAVCQASIGSTDAQQQQQQQQQQPPLPLLQPLPSLLLLQQQQHQWVAASLGLLHTGVGAHTHTGLQHNSSWSCCHNRSFCSASAPSTASDTGLASKSHPLQAGTTPCTSDASFLGKQQPQQPQHKQQQRTEPQQQQHQQQAPSLQRQHPRPTLSLRAALARSASKQLTASIMAAHEPQQLLQVLQQHTGCMDGFNVTAAFTRAKALCCPEGQLLQEDPAVAGLREALPRLVAAVAARGDPRQLSNIIWSSGYLQLPGVVSLLLPRMLQQLEQFSSRHLATALYGMARARMAPSSGQMQQLLAAFCARLPQAQPQNVSNVLWVAATLQHCVSPEQLEQMLDRFVSGLPQAKTQEVSNVVWSVATMQQQVPGPQLQLLLEWQVSLLQTATPQDISTFLWGVATMQQQIPAAEFQRLLERFTQLLPAAGSQTVKDVLWSAAKLQQQLPARQRRLLLARFIEQLPAVRQPQEISNTLWAVASMGQRMPARQLQPCIARFLQLLPAAETQAVKDVVWAVATMQQLGMRGATLQRLLSVEELTTLVDAFTQRLSSTTPQRAFILLWACSELRYYPQQLLQELRHHAPKLLAADFSELNVLVHALGSLGYRDDVLPGVLLEAAQERVGRLGGRTLTCLCWAAAVLDMQEHVPHVLRLAAACSEPEVWGSLPAPNVIQLYQVHRWLELSGLSAGGLSGALTPEQLQQSRAAWQQQAAEESQASHMQQQVFAALGRLPSDMWQQQPALEQPTQHGDSVIDIAATTAAGTRLAIEVDGPSHYLQPADRLDGRTQARNRALAAAGYQVVSIPWFDWMGLQTKQQEEKYLLQKLQGC